MLILCSPTTVCSRQGMWWEAQLHRGASLANEGWLLACLPRICCRVFLLGPSGKFLWWKTSLLLIPLQSMLIFILLPCCKQPFAFLWLCFYCEAFLYFINFFTFFVCLFEEKKSWNKDNHGTQLPSWFREIILWFKNTSRKSCERQTGGILRTTWNNWGINHVLCQWEVVAKLNELENWPRLCFLKYVQGQVHCKFFSKFTLVCEENWLTASADSGLWFMKISSPTE